MFVARVVRKRHSRWYYCGNCGVLLFVERHGVGSKRVLAGPGSRKRGVLWDYEARCSGKLRYCPSCFRPIAYPPTDRGSERSERGRSGP